MPKGGSGRCEADAADPLSIAKHAGRRHLTLPKVLHRLILPPPRFATKTGSGQYFGMPGKHPQSGQANRISQFGLSLRFSCKTRSKFVCGAL